MRRLLLVGSLLALIASGGLVVVGAQVPAVLTPVADAYTNSAHATKNFGRAATLYVRQGSTPSQATNHTLIRFNLGTPMPAGATLRLWVAESSVDGGTVYLTDAGWTEAGVTWRNEPARGAVVAQLGQVVQGGWLEVPMDASHLATQQLNLLIASSSADPAAYSSREGSLPAQLVAAPMTSGSPSPSEAAAPISQPATPSPVPTATRPPLEDTPSQLATPTPEPATPSPTQPPTGSPTAALTQMPEPTPTSRPASAEVVGYGSRTVGGSGGQLIEVRSVTQLSAALALAGAREIQLIGSGEWHANGVKLRIRTPYVTVDGSRCACYIRDGWLLVQASEVILRDLRIRTGDESVSAGDADPISVNGGTGAGISNIVIDHVEAIWGPDVGGVTILNNVRDVTIQHSIIGEGLFRSRHPEAQEDADGHSYALNVSGMDPNFAPSRITIFRNLITTSESRNPRVCGSAAVDLINNVIYNHREGPQCNPRSLNMVGNLLVRGPAAAGAGLQQSTVEFRHVTSADYPVAFPDAVFLSGNRADGYELTGFEGPPGVLRQDPAGALSVSPSSADGLLDPLLSEVGPSTRDAETLRIIANVRTRSGGYVSGNGVYPAR